MDAVVAMLTEDAAFSMPPMRTWFGGEGGHEELAAFLRAYPLNGIWKWKPLRVQANGQPALAFYSWDDDEGATCRSRSTCSPCAATRSATSPPSSRGPRRTPDPEVLARMPEQDFDERALAAAFGNFGLPERLD